MYRHFALHLMLMRHQGRLLHHHKPRPLPVLHNRSAVIRAIASSAWWTRRAKDSVSAVSSGVAGRRCSGPWACRPG